LKGGRFSTKTGAASQLIRDEGVVAAARVIRTTLQRSPTETFQKFMRFATMRPV
jgi:hypothetical protein